MTDAIKEFLVSISIDTDEQSQSKFLTVLGTVAKRVGEFAFTVKAAEAVLFEAIYSFSKNMDRLYYISERTGTTVKDLRALEYAAKQTGGEFSGLVGDLQKFHDKLEEIPNADKFVEMYMPNDEMRRRFKDAKGDLDKIMLMRESLEKSGYSRPAIIEIMRSWGIGLDSLRTLEKPEVAERMREEIDRINKLGEGSKGPSPLVQEVNRLKQEFNDILNSLVDISGPNLTQKIRWLNRYIDQHNKAIVRWLDDLVDHAFKDFEGSIRSVVMGVKAFMNMAGYGPRDFRKNKRKPKTEAGTIGQIWHDTLGSPLRDTIREVQYLIRVFKRLFALVGLTTYEKEPEPERSPPGEGVGASPQSGGSPATGGTRAGRGSEPTPEAPEAPEKPGIVKRAIDKTKEFFTGKKPAADASGEATVRGSVVPAGASSSAGAFATNRGVINRNPYNIGYGQFARAHGSTGAAGIDETHGVAVFPTFQAGEAAAEALIMKKAAAGRNTVYKMIAATGGWTPNANGPPAAAYVAASMGVGVHQPLDFNDRSVRRKFMDGLMARELGPGASRHVLAAMGRADKRLPPAPAEKSIEELRRLGIVDKPPQAQSRLDLPALAARSKLLQVRDHVKPLVPIGSEGAWRRTFRHETSERKLTIDVTGTMDPEGVANHVGRVVQQESAAHVAASTGSARAHPRPGPRPVAADLTK